MDKRVMAVRYSLFGRYDYIENTPENVSKLYTAFSTEGFMPNMVTLLKIEQPQNMVEQLIRPQLINQSLPCTITILPERVDIESGMDIGRSAVITYFERLIKIFELKINRIALNRTTILNNLTENEAVRLRDRSAPPENYYKEEFLMEYSSHRVSRKYVDEIGELINIGRNVTGIPSQEREDIVFKQVQIDTDINTIGENIKDRFDIEHCKRFFEAALKCDQEVLNKMVEITDAD